MPPKKTSKKSAKKTSAASPSAKAYDHTGADAPIRPDVGQQANFRQKKPPAKYRYDPTLDPQLSWDANPAREEAEALIARVTEISDRLSKAQDEAAREADLSELRATAARLRKLSQPFLNWAGKAEHQEIEVPTLPLFVHERLSTKAILESVEGRKPQKTLKAFFADPELDMTDRALKAYTHKDRWANRMILGDSLVVMNSLLRYEGLAGQVQMIYIDPPYGVKFGSNFQPFVRRRQVEHGRDDQLTREPEMIQAYRDTWELGLHSYLSHLRERLLLARELLSRDGSVFLQIGEENLHHVREIMDEVYGADNSCGIIAFRTTGGQSSSLLATSTDFLLWYGRDKERLTEKVRKPMIPKVGGKDDASGQYSLVERRDMSGPPRVMTAEESADPSLVPAGWRILAHDTLYSQGAPADPAERVFMFNGRRFECPANTHWKPGVRSGGMQRLAEKDRLMVLGNTLRYKRYLDDFPVYVLDNVWNDTTISGFARKKEYVVETSSKVVERCLLMCTEPGDLILDPTCGSGTTAYVSERWGRRWITIDTSRVPLALARQRILTATFPYYELRDEKLGPAGGFVYKRKQNKRGEEVGGIVPHVTLKSIAQGEEPDMEVLVDRPESVGDIIRVSGPFAVEATIPAPQLVGDPDGTAGQAGFEPAPGGYLTRMLEILRRSPVLRLPGGKMVEFRSLQSSRGIDTHATADVDTGAGTPGVTKVAIVFGPENGAVTEQLVVRAVKEANAKNYSHLFVIGFAVQDAATKLLKNSQEVLGMPVTYAQATMDILMGDLLKTTRSSQLFSVTGLPDIEFVKLKKKNADGDALYTVRLLAVDTFDPITMEPSTLKGDDVPAWMLDADYDEMCFRANQVFFPRTGAWDNLKRSLKGVFNDELWEHLAGTESEPFALGDHKRVAIKAIDERGNELLVVKDASEATNE